MGEHFRRDMSRDTHYRLIASLRLSEFGDGVVSQIMEAQPGKRAFHVANVRATFGLAALLAWILQLATRRALNCPRQSSPCGAPTRLRACRVNPAILASGKYKVV